LFFKGHSSCRLYAVIATVLASTFFGHFGRGFIKFCSCLMTYR